MADNVLQIGSGTAKGFVTPSGAIQVTGVQYREPQKQEEPTRVREVITQSGYTAPQYVGQVYEFAKGEQQFIPAQDVSLETRITPPAEMTSVYYQTQQGTIEQLAKGGALPLGVTLLTEQEVGQRLAQQQIQQRISQEQQRFIAGGLPSSLAGVLAFGTAVTGLTSEGKISFQQATPVILAPSSAIRTPLGMIQAGFFERVRTEAVSSQLDVQERLERAQRIRAGLPVRVEGGLRTYGIFEPEYAGAFVSTEIVPRLTGFGVVPTEIGEAILGERPSALLKAQQQVFAQQVEFQRGRLGVIDIGQPLETFGTIGKVTPFTPAFAASYIIAGGALKEIVFPAFAVIGGAIAPVISRIPVVSGIATAGAEFLGSRLGQAVTTTAVPSVIYVGGFPSIQELGFGGFEGAITRVPRLQREGYTPAQIFGTETGQVVELIVAGKLIKTGFESGLPLSPYKIEAFTGETRTVVTEGIAQQVPVTKPVVRGVALRDPTGIFTREAFPIVSYAGVIETPSISAGLLTASGLRQVVSRGISGEVFVGYPSREVFAKAFPTSATAISTTGAPSEAAVSIEKRLGAVSTERLTAASELASRIETGEVLFKTRELAVYGRPTSLTQPAFKQVQDFIAERTGRFGGGLVERVRGAGTLFAETAIPATSKDIDLLLQTGRITVAREVAGKGVEAIARGGQRAVVVKGGATVISPVTQKTILDIEYFGQPLQAPTEFAGVPIVRQTTKLYLPEARAFVPAASPAETVLGKLSAQATLTRLPTGEFVFQPPIERGIKDIADLYITLGGVSPETARVYATSAAGRQAIQAELAAIRATTTPAQLQAAIQARFAGQVKLPSVAAGTGVSPSYSILFGQPVISTFATPSTRPSVVSQPPVSAVSVSSISSQASSATSQAVSKASAVSRASISSIASQAPSRPSVSASQVSKSISASVSKSVSASSSVISQASPITSFPIIPPALPQGTLGALFGRYRPLGKRGYRYEPSLVGAQFKIPRAKGLKRLTGLEIRGI